MNFTQFLLILRARQNVIFCTLFLTIATTVIVSLIIPKTYEATTSLVLNYRGIDPVTGLTLPAQLMPGYMATQVDIINSPRIALQVVDDLKLADGEAVRQQFVDDTQGEGTIRDWLANLLLNKLKVVPSRESSVLAISFRGSDPQFAAAVANAFASAYQKTSVQLKVEPSQKASTYFNEQTKLLRERLEQAQNKLTNYQREHRILNADNRLDIESARLNELSTQLVAAQAQAMEANSRQRQAQSSAEYSPDVLSNPLIQNMKASLAIAEAKLADTAQKLEKNHPLYQAAKSEVDQLRSNLSNQIKIATSGIAGNARILQQREVEIRDALEAQKVKVMKLNSARDELKVLTNEMESAQRAYEIVSQRHSQTSMEGQSNQSDIAVLDPAIAPILPATPKLLLNVVVATILGTLLGLCLGMLAELINRRVRSSKDLTDVLQAPVLGVIQWTIPNIRERES